MFPEEQKRYEDYERHTEEQMRQDQEYARRPLEKPSLAPLLAALEASAMDGVREAHLDIGVLKRCKDRFQESSEIQAYTDMLITMSRYQIEEEMDAIARCNEYRKPG